MRKLNWNIDTDWNRISLPPSSEMVANAIFYLQSLWTMYSRTHVRKSFCLSQYPFSVEHDICKRRANFPLWIIFCNLFEHTYSCLCCVCLFWCGCYEQDISQGITSKKNYSQSVRKVCWNFGKGFSKTAFDNIQRKQRKTLIQIPTLDACISSRQS